MGCCLLDHLQAMQNLLLSRWTQARAQIHKGSSCASSRCITKIYSHKKCQQKIILFDCIIAIIDPVASPPRIRKTQTKGVGEVFLGRVHFQEISKVQIPFPAEAINDARSVKIFNIESTHNGHQKAQAK